MFTTGIKLVRQRSCVTPSLRQAGHLPHVVLVIQTVAERVAKTFECALKAVSDGLLPGLLDAEGLGLHALAEKLEQIIYNFFTRWSHC